MFFNEGITTKKIHFLVSFTENVILKLSRRRSLNHKKQGINYSSQAY